VEKGCCNLAKHIQNMKEFGVSVVVAVNRFGTDSDAEIDLVVKKALEAGADGAYPCTHFAHGGAGIADLAKRVVEVCEKPNDFKFLYPLDISLKEKIDIIVKKMYGGTSFPPPSLTLLLCARTHARKQCWLTPRVRLSRAYR
jgi:methylenetetrahydrofolate dehydrogenase (NADP+)/methenyltetrahydrofolate cyclohydrolase/formyltetrahydrofolate synthetase